MQIVEEVLHKVQYVDDGIRSSDGKLYRPQEFTIPSPGKRERGNKLLDSDGK